MRPITLFLLGYIAVIGSETTASVKLVNHKAVLPSSRILRPHRHPEFSARLSPNGKHILFPQQMKDKDETYHPVLLEIETNKEAVVPIDLPRGYETVFTRFNFFNPTGDKLVMFSMKQYPNPTVTEIVVYDIPSKTLTPTNITGNSSMAQFDSTGKNLVVSQHNSYVALASIEDFSIGKPLQSGWAHSCSPYSPYVAIFQQPNPRQEHVRFKLLNMESKKAMQLPVHERNKLLDDFTSHWNLDGRYIFYLDLYLNDSGRLAPVTRVWDTVEDHEKAIIHKVTCLGPGPTSNLMLMVSTEDAHRGNIRIYEIGSSTLTPVGDKSMKGIHAWRNRIIYVSTENGTENIYVADVKQ